MLTPEFRQVKHLFESIPEIGGVYFRPTDGRITVVDLHPHSPKPRIGVGRDPYIRCGATSSEVSDSLDERIAYLRDVRARQLQPSRENQFEARLIREAQCNHLCIPGCPNRLRFVFSQWRMGLTPDVGQRFTDLVAVDIERRCLAIIELKAEPDNSAFPQVQSYVEYFKNHWNELGPLFVKIAQVMGELYGCRDLASLSCLTGNIVPIVGWPTSIGTPVFTEVNRETSCEHCYGVSASGTQESPQDSTDIGPQCRSDSPFTARMRFHQSWYRSTVLRVPCGTGPNKDSTSRYGNMLTTGDGERGLNFVSPEAFAAANRRMAEHTGAVEPFRLLHNMLSSMPMCFNLFGPLAEDMGLATAGLQALLGKDEVRRVRELAFEYAPYPKSEYLNDGTAFDALISYERPDGSLGFLGIETKLTEPFSQRHYDSCDYRRWVERQDSPWPRDSWSQLDHIDYNQLWRGHLLATAMTHHPRSPYSAGLFVLVRHPGDAQCAQVVDAYKKLLKPQDHSFVDLTLDSVVDAWERAFPVRCSDWLDNIKLRYVDLASSDVSWLHRH